MKKTLLLALLTLLIPIIAEAYFVNNGIWYDYRQDGGATVIRPHRGPRYYSGDIVIPSSVTYNSTTYSVTSIAEDAFWNCVDLTSVTIPNSVTSIGGHAFEGCSGLTSITIPSSVTSIGGAAFADCTGLTSITILGNVSNIENATFSGCSSLTSFSIPNSATRIGERAFSGCSSLSSIYIPNGVTYIGDDAFQNCTSLISVTIPNSVILIRERTFKDCTALTSITIGNSVTSIGVDAFYNTAWYDNQPDGLVYAGKVAYKYKGTVPEGTEIELEEGTLGITDDAFEDCSGLTSITIPNSVTSIGNGVFYNCTGLTSVTIGNSVTRIGNLAFTRCSSLTSVTIPNSVTSIGHTAFSGCSSLASATITNSITSIEESVFLGCSSLTSVTIPNGVTSIGYGSFAGCTGLTSITIPNRVTSISGEAFAGCSNLKEVYCLAKHVPDATYAFVDLPDSENNTDIGSATLYVLASAIDDYKATEPWCQFGKIRSLEDNFVAGDIYYTINDDGSGVSVTRETADDYSYSGSVVIPSTIKHYESVYSVTSIDDYAFYGCLDLTSVTIPESVTSIGDYAFGDCPNLKKVYCLPKQVPETSPCAFANTDISSATLYVPESVLDDYKAAEPWKDFGTILPIDEPTYILGDANGNGEVEIGDITSVLTLMANPDATGYNNKAADANQSGGIEIGDITTILTIMAGGE